MKTIRLKNKRAGKAKRKKKRARNLNDSRISISRAKKKYSFISYQSSNHHTQKKVYFITQRVRGDFILSFAFAKKKFNISSGGHNIALLYFSVPALV